MLVQNMAARIATLKIDQKPRANVNINSPDRAPQASMIKTRRWLPTRSAAKEMAGVTITRTARGDDRMMPISPGDNPRQSSQTGK